MPEGAAITKVDIKFMVLNNERRKEVLRIISKSTRWVLAGEWGYTLEQRSPLCQIPQDEQIFKIYDEVHDKDEDEDEDDIPRTWLAQTKEWE